MIDQTELREQIAKALVTGAIGGWTEAQWDRITADTKTRELYLNAADDVLAVLPELTVRTVTTVAELDALPVHTVIRSSSARVAVMVDKWSGPFNGDAILSSWFEADDGEWEIPTDELADLPATILWTPTDGEQ